ncbi:MAG: MFS transporter [Actinomycetota bacterium]|nr:MFS transporter [Actinomycetota bacterium]
MVALPALREVLAGRDFRRLYGVRLVAQTGDGLLQAALATFVLFSPEREPDAVKVAAAFAILLLPYSVIGPFAGVFLDRWRRRNVLVRANLLKALVTLPIILLVLAGNDGPLLGLVVLTVLGIGRFVLAGLSASLPHVVAGRDLVTANALTPTSGTIMAAIGALAGVALRGALGGGDTGSAAVLACAVLAYVGSAGIAMLLAADRLGPDGERPGDTFRGVAVGLVEGIRELRVHVQAGRAIVVVGIHRIAFGVLTAGGLLLVRYTFNDLTAADTALNEFALLTGAAALGALVGAILTPGASRRWGAVAWSAFALAQAGIVGIALVIAGAMIPAFGILLAGAASIGFAGQSVKVCSDTLVQRHVPDDHLGRVFSLFDMIVNVCLVAGIVVFAIVSPTSGQAPLTYAAVGILLVATAVWYRLRRPNRVRTTDEPGG